MRQYLAGAVCTMLVLTSCGGSGERAAEAPSAEIACQRDDWPGPWTACAEAQWAREVVRRAGFRVVGETGSAFVAARGDLEFMIWTTPRPAEAIFEQEGTGRLALVAGTPVHGDERLWRFWTAQGFVFWIKQGPTETSALPSPHDLEAMIEESKQVPAPR